jgi:hypothetical protein
MIVVVVVVFLGWERKSWAVGGKDFFTKGSVLTTLQKETYQTLQRPSDLGGL